MATVYLVAVIGAGFALLALFNLSFPRIRGAVRSDSTRTEAARSWGSPVGEAPNRRVLLVGRASKDTETDVASLRAAGYDVRSCEGPEGSFETFPYGGCLLLNEDQCPLVSGADAIAFELELESGAARSVLRGYRATRPDTPVCVRTSDREAQWYADLLGDCRVAAGGRDGELVGLVENALDAQGRQVS